MNRRAPGTGTVTDRGGGRYLLRLVTADGKRHARTVRAESPEAARKQLDDLVALLTTAGHAAVGGVTFRAWCGEWLARRELARDRSVETYRSRIENHLVTASFADDLVANIRTKDIRSWLRALLVKLSPTTASPVLALMRIVLREAVEEELIDVNPAAEIRVPKAELKKVKKVRSPLTKVELDALLAGPFPLVERALIATTALAGLRSGEVHAMPLDHVERTEGLLVLHVEFGGFGGAPTKNGEERRVPVLGPARAIVEEWLATMPRGGRRNAERLLFPGPDGGRRDFGHASEWLRVRLRQVGIEKEIRFHDLRHTAATSLENGWYGPALAREHVQEILGHATMRQTEEYSGGAAEAMLKAARAFEAANRPNEPASQEPKQPKDQRRISELPAPHEIAAIQARSEPTTQRRP